MDLDSGDLERELCRIPEVFAARIVMNGAGRPTEARVLASPTRPPKRVRRDVQSVALAAFGLNLDPASITVTQLEQAPSASSPQEPDDGGEKMGPLEETLTLLAERLSETEADQSLVGAPQGRGQIDNGQIDDSDIEDQNTEHRELEHRETEHREIETESARPTAEQRAAPRDQEGFQPKGTHLATGPDEEDAVEQTAQAEGGAPEPLPTGSEDFVIEKVSLTVARRRQSVEVALRRNGWVGTGRAEGAITRNIAARIAAQAAVSALSQLEPSILDVEEATIVPSRDTELAIVTLVVESHGGIFTTSGAAMVGPAGPAHATACAVLDAAKRSRGADG